MTVDLNNLPARPGVYLMRDSKDRVLYVGKAINLKQRVRQYFTPGRDLRIQIPMLVSKVSRVETIIVSSEKEALLLEHSLIKKHHPHYNFLLKDDKSHICIQLTQGKWPALKLLRSKDIKETSGIFGPYPSAYSARKTLELLQKLFPLRECSDFVLKNRTRPCILHQIGRCCAPCVDRCNPKDYQDYVNKAERFLRGQDTTILKDLKIEMKLASENMEYEKAGYLLEMVRHIESLLEKQHVISNTNINCDVIGLYREGGLAILSLLIFKKGRLLDAKKFTVENDAQEDDELICSFIHQHYAKLKELPHELLSPIEIKEHTSLSELLSQDHSHTLKILFPKKGDKTALLQMAYDNAKADFAAKKTKKNSYEELLLDLKDSLRLSNYPEVIECFDNSHISGSNPVSVMITFTGGQYDKSRQRKFHLQNSSSQDDLKSFEEALTRRFENLKLTPPDLLVIDGGKTQLKIAQETLKKCNIIHVDVIAITKEKGRHDFGMTQERVFLIGEDEPVTISRKSPLLFFLQRVRDEAHRVAITFHRKSRSKTSMRSVLDQVPGIGPKKKRALIEVFKSPKQIKEASAEDLKKISAINAKDIENLKKFLEDL